jgi:ABC-type antimicrobial peptide transport system permease subunit
MTIAGGSSQHRSGPSCGHSGPAIGYGLHPPNHRAATAGGTNIARKTSVAMLTEIRYSARSLAQTPALAVALVLTIALGIGANVAVGGFVRGLAPERPIPQGDGLVSLFAPHAPAQFTAVPYPTFLSARRHSDTFEWLGAARESHGTVVLAGRTSLMSIASVTPELAHALRLDMRDGVVASERIRDLEPGADRGSPIRVDGVETRIAAFAPEMLDGLYVGRSVDLWVPLREESVSASDRDTAGVWPIGRLRGGVSIVTALAAVNRSDGTVSITPYSGMTPEIEAGIRRMSALLRAAAAAVFVIACANVMTFILSRASARARPTSVRIALGASRRDLARMLISDGVVIASSGGGLGVLLAVWTTQLIPALLVEQDAAHLRFAPDVPGVVSVSVVCAAITIACGLAPLIDILRVPPAAVLQRESAGPSKVIVRLRGAVMIAQMTLCVLLVASSALLLTGFRATLRTAVGTRLGDPILVTLQARHGFERQDLGFDYYRRAERVVSSVPGVTTTAWIGTPPGGSAVWQMLRVEPAPTGERKVTIDVNAFPSESAERLTFRVIAGRIFGGGDVAGACAVAVVNEVAARELFDNDAVGRMVVGPTGARAQVVGVVTSATEEHAAVPRPTIFFAPDQTAAALGPETFRVTGRPAPKSVALAANVVSANYFDAVGWERVEGRDFEDAVAGGCRVAMVDQDAADRYFGGHAVGAAIVDAEGRRTEIVGVVRGVALGTAKRRADPTIYYSMTQEFRPRLTLIAGTAKADAVLVALVRSRVEAVAGSATSPVVTTLEAHLSRTALAVERIASVLVSLFAGIAVALGILGLYGAMAEAARQRRRETAVRVALGAPRWRIVGRVFVDGGRLALAGVVAGLVGSLFVGRWLARATATPASPTVWTCLAAVAILTVAVILASILPARRSTMLNPFTSARDVG